MDSSIGRSIVLAAAIVSAAAIACTWMVTHADEYETLENGSRAFNVRTGVLYTMSDAYDMPNARLLKRKMSRTEE